MRKILYITLFFVVGVFMPASAWSALSSAAESPFILPQYSKTVSVDLKDANLKDVLKIFSKQIGVNFILSDKVKTGLITVMLDKVPLEEAFDKILTAHGLSYTYDPKANIFIINPAEDKKELVTRVYPLKNASVSSSKLATTFSIGSAKDAASDGIESVLRATLSKDGKIMTDSRTNSLVVMDIEENFPKIENALAKLDVPVVQVVIQVEMIDTSKSVVDSLGVKFSGNIYEFGLSTRSYYFPFNEHHILKKYEDAEVAYTASGMTSEFKAALQFLMTRSDSKTIARPRIMTMDNETAQMLIETDELVGVTRTVDEDNNETYSAERMKTGVVLTVTPQVDLLTGDILMAIDAKFTQASDSADLLPGSDVKFKDPETRGVKVKMKVRSKDTIVMAGMVRATKANVTTKLPFLGDLPLIGSLFRAKDKNEADRELLIVITPEIITGAGMEAVSGQAPLDISARETTRHERDMVIDAELDRTDAVKN